MSLLTDIRDHLVRGRERIKKGWTYGTLARNAEGEPVDPNSEEACSWCAIGAIHIEKEVYGESNPIQSGARKELDRIIQQGLHKEVPDWLHHSDQPMLMPPVVMFNDSHARKSLRTVDAQRVLGEIYDLAIANVEMKIAHES